MSYPATGAHSTRQPPPLAATVRLQFCRHFTLFDGAALVPALAQLGISHIYASPLLAARPGSPHGYDVVDPNRINSELGGEKALEQLVRTLHQHDMGLILDIVPNHMAVTGGHNMWWNDVLRWGPHSHYARYFDIRWDCADDATRGRVLLPFLRQDYGAALHRGEIRLHYAPSSGDFFIAHHEHRFPVSPLAWGVILRDATASDLRDLARGFDGLSDLPSADVFESLRSRLQRLTTTHDHHTDVERCVALFDPDSDAGRERLHALLQMQHYRLASWRTAADELNWRRFFDVSELAAVRVEDNVVFEALHVTVFELVQRGWVDGLRIDHIDGLANPRAYCRKLRRRIAALRPQSVPPETAGLTPRQPSATPPQPFFPIFVEKIVAMGERIDPAWGVSGSTGYEFMNQTSLLQHDPAGEQCLTELWHAISGRQHDFGYESYLARRQILTSALAGELATLARDLRHLARNDIATQDVTSGSLHRALTELIAHYPVYRSYAGVCGRSGDDERFFRAAVAKATRTLSQVDWPTLEQLDHWLGAGHLHTLPPGKSRRLRQRVLTRFQQLTSPVAAKGVEDTAFYRAGVLLSRYDVGFNAEQFSAPLALFHAECEYRAEHEPQALLTTATHDNKRGEDMRARLAVISECAPWFAAQTRSWLTQAESLLHQLPDGAAPEPAHQAIVFQTVIGSWPFADHVETASGATASFHSPLLAPEALPDAYLQRLRNWQRKALREARLKSHWWAPDDVYEHACDEFLCDLLQATTPEARKLRARLRRAAGALATAGALNSLAQCLLRMTTPGVPDLYQGADLWDLALVDPDNRRPVDFQHRRRLQTQDDSVGTLLALWPTAGIKQWLIGRTLQARGQHRALWQQADYMALAVEGKHSQRVIAFARHFEGKSALVIVPVRCAALLGVPDTPHSLPHVPPALWQDTHLQLPDQLRGQTLRSIYCGTQLTATGNTVPVAELLAQFPVNVYMSV